MSDTISVNELFELRSKYLADKLDFEVKSNKINKHADLLLDLTKKVDRDFNYTSVLKYDWHDTCAEFICEYYTACEHNFYKVVVYYDVLNMSIDAVKMHVENYDEDFNAAKNKIGECRRKIISLDHIKADIPEDEYNYLLGTYSAALKYAQKKFDNLEELVTVELL